VTRRPRPQLVPAGADQFGVEVIRRRVRTPAPVATGSPWPAAAVALVAVSGVMLLAQAAGAIGLLPADRRPAVSTSAGVTPLFRVTGLAPGEQRRACVDVQVSNAGRTPRVFFAGQDLRGSLAPALGLEVDAGPAGGTDCARFVGRLVFRGTVASLAADDSGRPVTGWHPGRDATWRFRLTVTAAADAPPASSASVGFAWRLTSAGGAATPLPPPKHTAEPVLPAGGASVPHVVLARPGPGSPTPLGRLLKVLTALVRHPVYPGTLLLLAGLFVLVQDRLDRRDPKLALAPVRNDDLHFPARPGAVSG